MSTRERLNEHLRTAELPETVPLSQAAFEVTVTEAVRFLCGELDRVLGPASVNFKKLYADAKVPVYQTDGASGLDLHAQQLVVPDYGPVPFPYSLPPGRSVQVWSGIAFSSPPSWEIQVRPRSSMHKARIHVCLGTVDADYRGEVCFHAINLSQQPFTIEQHDRLAQAVFVRVGRFELKEVGELDATKRGEGRLGSTGKQ